MTTNVFDGYEDFEVTLNGDYDPVRISAYRSILTTDRGHDSSEGAELYDSDNWVTNKLNPMFVHFTGSLRYVWESYLRRFAVIEESRAAVLAFDDFKRMAENFDHYEGSAEDLERVRDYHANYVRVMQKDRVTVWRGVLLDRIDDLDLSQLGIFWSFFKDTARPQNGRGEHNFVIEASTPVSGIDWEQGLLSYVGYGPSQWECYVSPSTELTVTRIFKDGERIPWTPVRGNTGAKHYAVWGWAESRVEALCRGVPARAVVENSESAELPRDRASRMARARELGFTVKAWHGTNSKFNEFDIERGKPHIVSGYAPHFADRRKEVFKLAPLPYDYAALEPVIDAETMKIHHGKHHAAYVARLNGAVAKAPELATKSIEELLKSLNTLPETVRADVRNHGGGHYNHALFWQHLKKGTGGPQGDLLKAIESAFGSVAKWQESFADAAMKQFGSGWAWLVVRDGKLAVEATPNQDCPLTTGGFPLLGVDVWEHAYYLKYQNRRADYVKAFQDVINWEFVGERFAKRA